MSADAAASPIDARLWIGGEAQAAAAGNTFAVKSPWDDRGLGHAARAEATDVDRAVHAARRASSAWRELAPGARERVLLAAADLVEARGTELFEDLLIEEGGGTISKARAEVRYTVELLRAAAGEARRLHTDTLPHDRADRLSLVVREPLGVVAVISPFNAPLSLLCKMLGFPLAAGNTLVIKPSEATPLVAYRLVRLFGDAGAPPGVVNLVTGFGSECGVPLVEHPGVDGIAFTGSAQTGRTIGAAAAARMARVQLELGGKNPVLVLADADPSAAAAIICDGAFAHAGQICMAAARIIVERPRFEDVLAALAARVDALHLGDRRDGRTAYGPLISDAALAKVQAHVDGAVAAGSRLLRGGRPHRGRVYAPTILADTPPSCVTWREETFGPVISVVAATDLDHAIELANDSAYGLSAAVLTRDLPRALLAARRLRSGAVHLGTHPFQSNTLAPVGGLGMSGIGRSGGAYSIEHFTELKWITADLGAAL